MSDPQKTQPAKKPPAPAPPPARFSVLFFLLAILVVTVVYGLLTQTGEQEKIGYSDLKKKVAAGEINRVELTPSLVLGRRFAPGTTRVEKTYKADRVEDESLVKLLDEKGIEYRAGADWSGFRSFLAFWVLPLGLVALLWFFLLRRIGPGSQVMSFGKSRARVYAESEVKVTFEDVAGVEEAKTELVEVVDFLRQPQKYQRLGGTIPKGILLVGPPGTGKTLLARAVAGEAKVPFFSLNGSDFVEMFVGVGASRVRDLFQQAQEKAPCIIFIDELDALGKVRGVSAISGHDEREQTLNQLLAEMDGFASKGGVILMAATNRPEILDPALLRPGRFDRQVLVDRPDLPGREAILRVHARSVKLAPEVDLRGIAAHTPGFAGADLRNLVNEAALLAARKDREAVTTPDFDEAIERVVAGLEKRQRVISDRERQVLANHESGHALAAELCPGGDPVHKISIVPRGIAALGYTLQLPAEDRYILSRGDLLGRLATMLGGRAAEEIVFNEVSTGAHNDLARASELARAMVTEYGMSEKFGPVTFERERKAIFLEIGTASPREFSEQTAREIDEEVRRIVQEAYALVKKGLSEKRETLDRIAGVLLEREVLKREEFLEIIYGTEEAARRIAEEKNRSTSTKGKNPSAS